MAAATLPSGHQLLKLTTQLLAKRRRWLFQVIGTGLLVNLLIGFTSSGEAASVYQSLWFIFYSSSLIWALRHLPATKRAQPPELSLVYWEGSAAALKLLIILSLVTVASAPFWIGALLFSTINYLSVDSISADIIALVIWLICAWLSLLLLARLSLALVITTLPKVTPFRSINLSWNLTKKRTVAVAKRLALLFGYLLLIMALITAALALTGAGPEMAQFWLEVASLGVILPLVYGYLFLLYKQLA